MMIRSMPSPSAALLLVLSLLPLVPADAGAQRIWRGRSGGYDVAWSAGDVAATRVRDGARVLSLARLGEAEWGEMTSAQDPETDPAELETRYRVLSFVGPVISLERFWYCDCRGAHPISMSGFVTYDLSRSTPREARPARATDYVSEADLHRALLADRLIRAALDSADVRTPPATLGALLAAIEHQPIEVDGCTYSTGADFLEHFAFHHLEGGRVALRFSLSHYVEICRGNHTQVGVLVPVSPRLRPDLAAADARRAGFLMKDARAVGGNRVTTLSYQPKRR
ncbi:MAG TPA: hypothetical protein VFQ39_15930 [Longimicrobium sp.]|nr:hypothetical protein [Longimicrobium sp.]